MSNEPTNIPKLKVQQIVSLDNEKGKICISKVLGQAGKSTRKYKNYFNIEYLVASNMSQHQSFMNLDNVKHINLLDEIALRRQPVNVTLLIWKQNRLSKQIVVLMMQNKMSWLAGKVIIFTRLCQTQTKNVYSWDVYVPWKII